MVLRQRFATTLGTPSPKWNHIGRNRCQTPQTETPKTPSSLLHMQDTPSAPSARRRVDLVGVGCAVRTTCPRASCANSSESIPNLRDVCLHSSQLKVCTWARNTHPLLTPEHNLKSHTRDHPQVSISICQCPALSSIEFQLYNFNRERRLLMVGPLGEVTLVVFSDSCPQIARSPQSSAGVLAWRSLEVLSKR